MTILTMHVFVIETIEVLPLCVTYWPRDRSDGEEEDEMDVKGK